MSGPAVASQPRVLNNFQALSEFWGFHDTCGPDALLMTLHATHGETLSGPEVDKLRDDMMRDRWFAPGGTTLHKIALEAKQDAHPVITESSQIKPTLDKHAGINGIVLFVNRAYMLPYNEAGVGGHFVAIGGYDPQKGYLVGNGDDINALASHNGHGKIIPTRWMTWNQIAAADPGGVLVIQNQGGPTGAGGVDPCQPLPDWAKNVPGAQGVFDVACLAGIRSIDFCSPVPSWANGIPGVQGIFDALCKAGQAGAAVESGLTLWDRISTQFATLIDWMSNPIRIVKMATGLSLILIALVVTFLPEAAGAAAIIAGQPELAPTAYRAGQVVQHPVKSVRAAAPKGYAATAGRAKAARLANTTP